MANDEDNDTKQTSIDETDPAATDVIAQQGVNPDEVEKDDRLQLQQQLTDQGTKSHEINTEQQLDVVPLDEATDDRDTSDGQLISS